MGCVYDLCTSVKECSTHFSICLSQKIGVRTSIGFDKRSSMSRLALSFISKMYEEG